MKTLFKIVPALGLVFADSLKLKSPYLIVCLWYFVISRKLFNFKNDFEINVQYKDKGFKLYLRRSVDLVVLHEVFYLEEYAWKLKNNPKIIIDLGAHFGDTALFYNAVYPESLIIAVEPSTENFSRLVQHTKGIDNIKCINVAIGDTDGIINLYTNDSSLGHSTKRNEEKYKENIKQLALETLLKEFGIHKADLVKFDIEGSEESLFKNVKPEKIANNFIGELHEDLMSITAQNFSDYFGPNFEVLLEQCSDNKKRFMFKAEVKDHA